MLGLRRRIHAIAGDSKRIGSLLALLLVNLLPIAGVLFFGWRVFDLLLLYWAESVLIGLLNVPKMWIAVDHVGGTAGPTPGKVGLSFFFLVHYMGFMAGHAAFMTLMTAGDSLFDVDMQEVPGIILGTLGERSTVLGLLALLGSHLVSFFLTFIGRREYLTTSVGKVMFSPYPRVMVMQFAIVLGGFFVMLLDLPGGVLAILVIGKIILDVHAHLKEHESREAAVEQIPAAS